MRHTRHVSVTVPSRLRHVHGDTDGGQEWLDSIPARVARAVERWDLVVGEPFEEGMAAWTAPATTTAERLDVVLKVSWPCRETRDEAAALAAWQGAGAVEVFGANADDSALLLRRLRPGSTLRDERLPARRHLTIGADLLRRMAAAPVRESGPFQDLAEVAGRLAVTAAERVERLLPAAPIPIDTGLCDYAIDLLRTLPGGAAATGLAHGDFNPGNILRHVDAAAGSEERSAGWLAIDPEPVYGDLAWDPWPLLTQVGDDWTTIAPDPADLAQRALVVADLTGLDAARSAAWCVARGVEHGLWAADRGWWTGFLGADGDLARSSAWAKAITLLGG
jgi:streptomycin 6-kinase